MNVHRQDDARICGATTVVQNQSTVFVNSKLWSVKGSIDSHGSGALINSGSSVFINGIPVVIKGDHAQPDNLCFIVGPPHCDPIAVGCSPDVFCY